jgi:hypothetical protein
MDCNFFEVPEEVEGYSSDRDISYLLQTLPTLHKLPIFTPGIILVLCILHKIPILIVMNLTKIYKTGKIRVNISFSAPRREERSTSKLFPKD